MVQTQHFTDLAYDRIDLVLGSKGSGKSSLFRMFGELLEPKLFTDWKTIVVSGVETRGDPIFKTYTSHFEKFTEHQFESFWRAYLLSLAYNKINYDDKVAPIVTPHEIELKSFRQQYKHLGLLDAGRVSSPTKLLKLVCAFTLAAIEGDAARYNEAIR
jgi:energy-coupling factor transporter ATP-binding protein EcfA2